MRDEQTEATQDTGVETEVTDEALETATETETEVEATEVEDVETAAPILPRDKMMQELVEQQRDERGRSEHVDPPGREEEATETATDTPEESDDDLIDLKVDGKIVQKTRKEVNEAGGVAAIQKSLSADQRLEAAIEQRRKLEEQGSELEQREQSLVDREKALDRRLQELEDKIKNPPAPKVTDEQVAGLVDKFTSSVYSGKESDAKDALMEVITAVRSTQPDIDVSGIVQEASALAVFESERNLGKREMKRQYPGLFENKDLLSMTNRETTKLMQQHPDWSPYDIIMTAARNIDDWSKSVVGDETGTTTTTEVETTTETAPEKDEATERQERKRGSQPLRTASTRARPAPGYKPKSKEQIFNEYRQNRVR